MRCRLTPYRWSRLLEISALSIEAILVALEATQSHRILPSEGEIGDFHAFFSLARIGKLIQLLLWDHGGLYQWA